MPNAGKPSAILVETAEKSIRHIDRARLHGKRVLVLGGSGLVGINMVAALLLAGANVRATCAKAPTPWMLDILESTRWGYYHEGNGDYDFIICAAGYAQPALFMKNPVSTIYANTTLLMESFRWLKPNGRLLFISSSEVYSGALGPHSESHIGTTTPQHPRAAYIESKRCGEAICAAYGRRAATARLSMAYGPGSRLGDLRAMNQFIEAGLRTGHVMLRDNGEAQRRYFYISDAVEMLLTVLLNGTHGVYNVGAPTATSVANMALQVAVITGAHLQNPVCVSNDTSPSAVHMDCTRYHDEFVKPSYVGLGLGVRETVQWYRALLNEEAALSKAAS